MITVKEKFSTDNLFQLMNEKNPFEWANDFTPERMGKLFLALYGNYVVASSFETMSNDDVADSLAGFYITRWNHIYNFMFSDDLLKIGYIENITETVSDTGTSENKETENEINKVSAYNDDSMSDDTTKDNTVNRNGTTSNKKERSYTRQGFHDGFAKYRLDYLNRLQNDFIYDIIFKEVKTLLTAPLYNGSL